MKTSVGKAIHQIPHKILHILCKFGKIPSRIEPVTASENITLKMSENTLMPSEFELGMDSSIFGD